MKKETFWIAYNKYPDWSSCPQIAYSCTPKQIAKLAQFAATLYGCKVRVSRSEGYNNQGSYFLPEF